MLPSVLVIILGVAGTTALPHAHSDFVATRRLDTQELLKLHTRQIWSNTRGSDLLNYQPSEYQWSICQPGILIQTDCELDVDRGELDRWLRKRSSPHIRGTLSAAEIAQKKAAGRKARLDRTVLRAANARNQIPAFSGIEGRKLYNEYARPEAAVPRIPGSTRAERQDFSKPSTGVDKTNNVGTTHLHKARITVGRTPRVTKLREDAERVVGESLRHPSNPITHGAGPKAANTLVRAVGHQTKSTAGSPGLIKNPGQPDHNDVDVVNRKAPQEIVTAVFQDPKTKEQELMHLPMIFNPRTGEGHFDDRQKNPPADQSYGPNNLIPPLAIDKGPEFFPRKRSLTFESGEHPSESQ